MAIKNYMINDKWLDIAKENIVEVQSTDGVIGSVKVNGQEYGGGGGSSEFSTANVRFVCTVEEGVTVDVINSAYLDNNRMLTNLQLYGGFDYTIPTVLYKSTAPLGFSAQGGEIININVTGNATIDPDYGFVIVTGDCTITISDGE